MTAHPPARLSFRALVLGEFRARGAEDRPAPARGPVAVTPANLDRLFFRECERIPLVLETSTTGTLSVDLSIRSFADFRPDRLALQVPSLRSLQEAVQVLEGWTRGTRHREEAAARLAAIDHPLAAELAGVLRAESRAVPPPATPGGGGPAPPNVGRDPGPARDIRDLVDFAGPRAESGDAPAPHLRSGHAGIVDRLIAAGGWVKPRAAGDREDAARWEDLARTVFRSEACALAEHPELRRLEELWRGLRFLVDHTDDELGAGVDLIACPRTSAAEELRRFLSAVEPRVRPDLIVGAHPWDDGEQDAMGDLAGLAAAAAEARIPLIAGVDAAFVHRVEASEAAVSVVPSDAGVTGAAGPANLRASESSRWLFLLANRFAFRPPHARRGRDHLAAPVSPTPPLWANAAWGAAALTMESLRRTGDPTDVLGPEGGRLRDLPVAHADDREGSPGGDVLEMAVDRLQAGRLESLGFGVFVCFGETDSAVLFNAPAFHAGRGVDSTGIVDLPAALFATRVMRAANMVEREIGTGEPAEARAMMATGLTVLLGLVPRVEVEVDAARRDRLTYSITVDAPRRRRLTLRLAPSAI